jgi:hypothetical protein
MVALQQPIRWKPLRGSVFAGRHRDAATPRVLRAALLPRSSASHAAMIKQLIVNHAVRRVVSVVIYAGLIGLAMTIA